jgi:hypothetical protein
MIRVTVKSSPSHKAPFSELTMEGDPVTAKGEEREYWALMRKWTIGDVDDKPNLLRRLYNRLFK